MFRKLMLALAMAAMTALVAVPALADDKKVDGKKKKGDTNTALAANLLTQTNFAEVNGDYNVVGQANIAQQQAAAAAGDNATATNFFGVFVGGNDDNGNDNGSHGKKDGKKGGADNFAACLNAADQYNAAIVDGDYNVVGQANIAQQQCAAAAGDNAFAGNAFVVDVEDLGALAGAE